MAVDHHLLAPSAVRLPKGTGIIAPILLWVIGAAFQGKDELDDFSAATRPILGHKIDDINAVNGTGDVEGIRHLHTFV